MSRKREQQRDNKRTLARQMGVSGREVPQELIDNERVTEPSIAVRTTLEHRATPGLLSRLFNRSVESERLDVHVCLWCCSSKQVRLVRSISGHAMLTEPGPVTLYAVVADDHGFDVVRYRRPGFFVVTSLITVGRSPLDVDIDRQALHAASQVTVAGEPAPRSLLTMADATTATPVIVAGLSTSAPQATVLARAAADRVKETLTLPVSSRDGQLRLTVSIDLRL
jgi:hypothetical protein